MKLPGVRASCVAVALIVGFASMAEPLPLESFARHEAMKSPRISPDGRFLAVISSKEGRRVGLVRDLKGDERWTPVISADAAGTADLEWCEWVTDKRLLCGFTGVAPVARRFLFANVKLALVDADGKNLKESLTMTWLPPLKFDAGIIEPGSQLQNQVIVRMSTLPPDIRGFNPMAGAIQYHFVIDIDSGKSSPGRGEGVQRRVRSTITPETNRIEVSSADGKDWTTLQKATEFSKANPLTDVRVNAATGRALGYALQNGRKALWEFTLDDRTAPTVAIAHPKVDIGDLLVDRKGAVLGVSYESERPRTQYADEKLTAIMRGIDKLFPDTFNRIESLNDNRTLLVIATRSDIEAGRYYLYDAASSKLTDIGSQYPDLERQRLARTTPVEIAAQDGAKIPGYLTVPPALAGQKAPLIVAPHSGYDGRARLAYDPLAQFLASRGYAVLTVNYRGSVGYGAEWLQAGRGNWDTVVISDVADAARWAVSQGIADPARVCALGQGYGGYAAQLSAIRHSDLFRCAIGLGARTDAQLYSTLTNGMNNQRYYIPLDEREQPTRRRSALLESVEQAKAPILLIHGTQDTRAPIAQAESFAQALAGAGKQHKLVKIDKADHSFWRESERATVLKEVEEFLAGALP